MTSREQYEKETGKLANNCIYDKQNVCPAKAYEAADALDAYCTTGDGFEGDVPDDVWIPFHKAMMEYEKGRRLSAPKEEG